MVSITLVVVSLFSLVLVLVAVIVVFTTARGDSATDAALKARVTLASAARTSGDVHLFVRYPEDVAKELLAELAALGDRGRIEPENVSRAASLLRAAIDRATDAHASYARFHLIRFHADDRPGTTLYVALRSRTPLETVSDASDREAVGHALDAIAALEPSKVVSAVIVEAEHDRDPASPALLAFR